MSHPAAWGSGSVHLNNSMTCRANNHHTAHCLRQTCLLCQSPQKPQALYICEHSLTAGQCKHTHTHTHRHRTIPHIVLCLCISVCDTYSCCGISMLLRVKRGGIVATSTSLLEQTLKQATHIRLVLLASLYTLIIVQDNRQAQHAVTRNVSPTSDLWCRGSPDQGAVCR